MVSNPVPCHISMVKITKVKCVPCMPMIVLSKFGGLCMVKD